MLADITGLVAPVLRLVRWVRKLEAFSGPMPGLVITVRVLLEQVLSVLRAMLAAVALLVSVMLGHRSLVLVLV